MKIYAPGTRIITIAGNLQMIIKSILIHEYNSVEYYCGYVNGNNDYCTCYLNESEFATDQNKIKIGFKNGTNNTEI